MKRVILSSLCTLSLMVLLVSCSLESKGNEIEGVQENTLISQALEQGKIAVLNNELEVAENSFNLILSEDGEHEEAKDWLELLSLYDNIVEKMGENDLEGARLFYQELHSHKYRSAMRGTLDDLRKYLQMDPEYGKYTNTEYGFSFDYPGNWIGRIEIREKEREDFDDTVLSFYYVNKDKGIDEFVFEINILNEYIAESNYNGGMGKYLSSADGRTFEAVFIGGPTQELLKPENQNDLDFIVHMIGDVEFQVVVDTFKIDQESVENGR